MALRSGDLMELMKELESTLAHIIGACIEKVGVALVENNRKWAQEMKEKKLLETVYIAGKSIGLIEKLGWDHKLRIAPDSGFNAPNNRRIGGVSNSNCILKSLLDVLKCHFDLFKPLLE